MAQRGFTLIELLIVVAIIGIIAAIAIPSLLNALERAKQTSTVDRISTLGKYVEQYMMDNPNVGAPKVGNDVEALNALFISEEINFNESAVRDGWGNTILIEMDANPASRRYTIQSYGADGKAGPNPETPGRVQLFVEDIIWSRGIFVQRPEGLQRSGR